MKLNQQHVLITGANRGIGLGLAKAMASEKTHLHLVIRKSDPQLCSELMGLGAISVTEWIFDLSSDKDLQTCFEKLQKTPMDILINNAGLLTGGLIEEQNFSDIQKMFQVNLLAVIRLSQAVIPGMIQRKKGKIVNNASVSAIMHFPSASTYAAGKAAILAFTNCISHELKDTGVSTLTLITPGVKTQMFDDIETMYAKNIETPKDSISTSEYAQQVIEAIKNDEEMLTPRGATLWGLMIAKYIPTLFNNAVRKRFRR